MKWDTTRTNPYIMFSMNNNAFTQEIEWGRHSGALESEIKYEITEGADQTWKKGSGKDLTITCNGDLSGFTGLTMDGASVDKENYTKTSGSTIITLKAPYLETFSVGTHTIELFYSDVSVSTGLTIVAADESNGMLFATGDPTLWWIFGTAAVLIISAGALIWISKSKSKKKNKI